MKQPKKFNQFLYIVQNKEVAMSWKLGKYWLATVFGHGSLGGFKSFRHSHAAILRVLNKSPKSK